MWKNVGGAGSKPFSTLFGGIVDKSQIWGGVSKFFIRYGLIVQKVCGTPNIFGTKFFSKQHYFFKTQNSNFFELKGVS